MNTDVILTISSLLATLLVVINIFIATIRKPQENQETSLRNTERAFNEFLITYSGENAGLKLKIEQLREQVDELKETNKQQNAVIDELARKLMLISHEHSNNKNKREG
jgi:cell division protein FtsB